MGLTEIVVIVFLLMLGYLAYNNSKKVSKDLEKFSTKK